MNIKTALLIGCSLLGTTSVYSDTKAIALQPVNIDPDIDSLFTLRYQQGLDADNLVYNKFRYSLQYIGDYSNIQRCNIGEDEKPEPLLAACKNASWDPSWGTGI